MVGGEESRDTTLDAVVRVGACSGVFVTPTALLTSAHCVEATPKSAASADREYAIETCTAHPDGITAAHDLAVCRVTSPASSFFKMNLNPAEKAATSATLAGFGQPRALAREPPRLRSIDVEVTHDGSAFIAGTSARTACRGDSGGPVLRGAPGAYEVVGLIRGPTGAICASPTEWTPLFANSLWLTSTLEPRARAANGAERSVSASLVLPLVVIVATLAWLIRQRLRTR